MTIATKSGRFLPALALLASATAGCGGGEDTESVSLSVSFPSEGARSSTNTVHFWVLEPRPPRVDGAEPLGCRDLRLKEVEPYDIGFDRLADVVVILADGDSAAPEVRSGGERLVYAEAVGFAGELLLSGCQVLDQGSASVALSAPRTFDCAAPDTEDGAPCDDGLFCTTGETCSGGSCQGGGPRNCTHLADACNAEACSEQLGCHTTPASNNTPCEDGLFCTAGDLCMDGECVGGTERDCSVADGECRTGTCDEGLQQCVSELDDAGATCEDGFYCTELDSCSIGGICDGSPVDCSAAEDDCNLAACSEGEMGACVRTPTNQGGLCSTNCTSGGTCNAGACEGGTPLTPGVEGPAGDASCTDYLDNDCDGDFDADDTDCQ